MVLRVYSSIQLPQFHNLSPSSRGINGESIKDPANGEDYKRISEVEH